jgi:2-methylcitrate synthase
MVDRAAKGLADIVAANTAISNVDGRSGTLSFRGYDIDQLIGRTSFEEVAFLLQRGALPGRSDLAGYRDELAAGRTAIGPAASTLVPLVARAEPMAALRTLVSALSADDPDATDTSAQAGARKSARLVAQVPVLLARYAAARDGREAPEPRDDLGVAGNLLWQLRGTEPDAAVVQILDQYLVLLAEHTMNASTFAARVCAATLSDLHSAVTAAISTLKGPLHGGAGEAVLALLAEVGSPDAAAELVGERLGAGTRIVGFGHRAYKGADPRTRHVRALSERLVQLTGERRQHALAVAVQDAVVDAGGPPPNVDLFAAVVQHGLGIAADLTAPVLAVARTAGWTAHAMEQHADNRLIRPDAAYIGPKRQVWMPIQERV